MENHKVGFSDSIPRKMLDEILMDINICKDDLKEIQEYKCYLVINENSCLIDSAIYVDIADEFSESGVTGRLINMTNCKYEPEAQVLECQIKVEISEEMYNGILEYLATELRNKKIEHSSIA